MNPIDEKNVIIQGAVIDKTTWDFLLQFEQALILFDKPSLLSFIVSILLLDQIGYIYFKTQKQLAERMGFSEPTFIKNRKELERMGLIGVTDKNNRRVIDLKNLSRLKNFKLPSNSVEHSKYIDISRQLLLDPSKKEAFKAGQLPFFDNIYISNTIKSNSNTSNTNSVNSNRVKSNIVKGKTYPKEDYTLVIDAFKKYKGVGLVGPEIAYHLRAIKLMFQAEHKPKEIIDFMKWLHDNEKNEETPWVRNWTIWTVQKKFPEFLGGKLKVGNSIEEEFPAYDKRTTK